MSLHYFLPREPKPEPVAQVLRGVAYPAERGVPPSIASQLPRLGPR